MERETENIVTLLHCSIVLLFYCSIVLLYSVFCILLTLYLFHLSFHGAIQIPNSKHQKPNKFQNSNDNLMTT
jgi:hypothetical protein